MRLTIEQVRDSKFHLARRNGYEPVDVDNFVDQVEETLVALNDEIETLKKQGGGDGSGSGDEALRAQLADKDAELERLRGELSSAHAGDTDEVSQLRADLDSHRGELSTLREQAQTREGELNGLREQLFAANQNLSEGKTEHLVLTSAPEASLAVTRLLEMATKQADDLVNGAQAEADRRLSEADTHAQRTKDEAQQHATSLVAEAQQRRDNLEAEHDQRKAALETEIGERRTELFSTLDDEHRTLTDRVGKLRDYEKNYRDSVTASLQQHIENVRNARLVPEDKPELLDIEPGTSHTPKLDGLLKGENGQ